MNTIKLYKNPNPYPFYGTISEYKSVQASPRNQNVRTGYVDLQLSMGEIFNFNYLSFTRDGRTVYAWVENIEDIGGNKLWRVHYATDAFRTYKSELVLGTQFIARSPVPTLLEDNLLSSAEELNEYEMIPYSIGNTTRRFMVAQLRISLTNWASNTPGQPSPYTFLFAPFTVKNWVDSTPVINLLRRLSTEAKSNVVSLYSIPDISTSGMTVLDDSSAPLKVGTDNYDMAGWYYMREQNLYSGNFINNVALDIPAGLTKTRHSVFIVIPEAGTLRIPTDLLYKDGLCLRRDIDPFSGVANYMIAYDNGLQPTNISIRGGAMADIPVLSDPYDTYISQNQNTLKASLLGDTATLATGIVMGEPMAMMKGIGGMFHQAVGLADAANVIPSNPPAFFGNAVLPTFNGRFYLLIVKKPYDNENYVHTRYGYPMNRIGPLTIPASGFIQTNNCSVSSTGGVPLWAINEINQLFNAGILFK